ncbi:MAG: PH domain-containing protein [Planctomycetales bacterium]
MHWYRSKIDWWLAVLMCIPPVTSVGVCVALVRDGVGAEWMWGVGSVLFVAAIYFGLIFPMRYGLDDAYLRIRSGIFRKQIPLVEVSEVYPTRNPLSSPALSLDRLYVKFGAGFFKAVMISPADRDRFLEELATKAGLRRDGERLFRV